MILLEQRMRALFDLRVVPVIRASGPEQATRMAELLHAAGFGAIEITMTVPGAMDVIARLAKAMPDVMIGAGTVLSGPQAVEVIRAGAQFVVSPTLETDIIRPCREAGAVSIPAGMTPTEILRAWQAGANVVKVFPAQPIGGVDFIKALRGPLPEIPLWVSGLVMAKDAPAYFHAGVQLVGLGGAELLPPDALAAGDDAAVAHAAGLLKLARGG
ncbi:MAG TPA: bifunctional 4-hydroxy-2-oxoglutarate aldolase/2-dehydro-3-deoxy-phosphogluconate aldolase [Thermoflexales bacterium]|nr:bifunctional 4-hydroxy-2-oxoglutarate aldolase/2-dehydro-3-deoxy-phosphogluconate aldolase [Thermoflexales bacterium]HQZ23153.1 bifunctional 4-hydroxy-2-oxoglutarate aldolase/2-dehydro-3-deoxy-phosphogluconate aldolase [Thermoflexales bacterium]HRA00678.1 bifunctional 4-hydroxy-2-oxoglutarate aldolase/2-dehydro-3-deoxy-phosphogluconate aldolase [Thermoflexales bacterium]